MYEGDVTSYRKRQQTNKQQNLRPVSEQRQTNRTCKSNFRGIEEEREGERERERVRKKERERESVREIRRERELRRQKKSYM